MMRQPVVALLFMIASLFSSTNMQASHVAGGEMYYECLGGQTFRIYLEFRRDCFNGATLAQFDDPAVIGIFDSAGNFLSDVGSGGKLFMNFNESDTLNETLTSECAVQGEDVCVQRTIYFTDVDVPFNPDGYIFAYQRCCRNISVSNILEPNFQGATYWTEITSIAQTECNSSPIFLDWPSIYLCANEEVSFNHAAFDLDGDSLAYKLCVPNSGASFSDSKPDCPAAPPYASVEWNPPFDLDNLLGGVPLTIDPVTGMIHAVPNLVGQYLVGVCVEEYRNGQLIGFTKRDFEYNVRICEPHPLAGLEASDTLSCDDLTVSFTNTTLPPTADFKWFFEYPDTSIFLIGNATPSYTYSAPGLYTVALAATDGTCFDTAFIDVGVSLAGDPNAFFSFSSDDCQDTIQLQLLDESTSTQSLEWEWTVANSDSTYSYNTQNVNASLPGNQNYTISLLVTSESGCTSSYNETIDLNQINFGINSDTLSICDGQSVQIANIQPATIDVTWSPTTGLDLTNLYAPVANPLVTTTYFVEADNGFCVEYDTVTVDVITIPTIDISASGLACDSIHTLTASGATGVDFAWYSDSGFTNVIGTENPLELEVNGDQWVYVNQPSLPCTDIDSFFIIDGILDVEVTFMMENEFCVDAIYQVLINNMHPSDDITVEVITNATVVTSTSEEVELSFPGSGLYDVELMISNADNCMQTESVQISILDYPDFTLNDSEFICFGDDLILNPGSNANIEYTWTTDIPNLVFDETAVSPLIESMTQSGSFFLTVNNPGDDLCTLDFQVAVTVPDEIVLEYTGDTFFCEPSDVLLEANSNQPGAYTWTNLNDGVVTMGAIFEYALMDSAMVVLNFVGDDGCTKDTTISLNAEMQLNLELTSSTGEIYCEDEEVILSATYVGDADINWIDEGGFVVSTLDSLILNPEEEENYTVIVTNSAGCKDTSMISIIPSIVDLEVLYPSLVCEGEEIVITVVNANPNQTFEYTWMVNGITTVTENPEMVIAPATEDLEVSISAVNENDCAFMESFAIVVSIVDEVIITADPDFVYLTMSTQLSTNQDPNYSYNWSPVETLDDPFSDSPIAIPTEEVSTYMLTVTNEDGCTGTGSISIDVRLPECTEEDVFVPNTFSPNGDNFNDVFKVESNFIETMELLVYNRWGEQVYKTNMPGDGWNGTYKGKDLEPGVYAYLLNVTCVNDLSYAKQGSITLMK